MHQRTYDRLLDRLWDCGGSHPSEWPAHGHLLSPLHDAHVKRLRGDDFVIVGHNLCDAIRVHATCPQAWWCRPSNFRRNSVEEHKESRDSQKESDN